MIILLEWRDITRFGLTLFMMLTADAIGRAIFGSGGGPLEYYTIIAMGLTVISAIREAAQ